MVCVDQENGEKGTLLSEPYSTLAKTRRWDGRVWFGMHLGLAFDEDGNGDGDGERGRVGGEEDEGVYRGGIDDERDGRKGWFICDGDLVLISS